MISPREVVITGMGVVSPIGIGCEAYAESLRNRQSGVRRLENYNPANLQVDFGGEVRGFDPKHFVTPRKSLKIMSREIQLGFAAANLACEDAALSPGSVDPDRLGVIFGADMIYGDLAELSRTYIGHSASEAPDIQRWIGQALAELNPLWLLKNLPNMPACHFAIAIDARGPNNTVTMGEVSSLAAIAEAVRVIERGAADAIVVGGVGSRIHPMVWLWQSDEHLSHRREQPAKACRPFDAERDGVVQGEGSAALVLETRQQAESRGAVIRARVAGVAIGCEPPPPVSQIRTGRAIKAAMRSALVQARLAPKDIGHVNAHGLGAVIRDQVEATAIQEVLGNVPVTALKSYFGHLGAGSGMVEAIGSLLALGGEPVPATLNYERPDPRCPVNVVREPIAGLERRTAMLLNDAMSGQCAAVVICAE